jgi:hypothetical protein
MQGVKLCNIPLQFGVQLSKLDDIPLTDHVPYRTIIGMLQYTIIIKPHLTCLTNKISQFFAYPTEEH